MPTVLWKFLPGSRLVDWLPDAAFRNNPQLCPAEIVVSQSQCTGYIVPRLRGAKKKKKPRSLDFFRDKSVYAAGVAIGFTLNYQCVNQVCVLLALFLSCSLTASWAPITLWAQQLDTSRWRRWERRIYIFYRSIFPAQRARAGGCDDLYLREIINGFVLRGNAAASHTQQWISKRYF